jgi:hypothetical protein
MTSPISVELSGRSDVVIRDRAGNILFAVDNAARATTISKQSGQSAPDLKAKSPAEIDLLDGCEGAFSPYAEPSKARIIGRCMSGIASQAEVAWALRWSGREKPSGDKVAERFKYEIEPMDPTTSRRAVARCVMLELAWSLDRPRQFFSVSTDQGQGRNAERKSPFFDSIGQMQASTVAAHRFQCDLDRDRLA